MVVPFLFKKNELQAPFAVHERISVWLSVKHNLAA